MKFDEKGRCPRCSKNMCMGYGICTCKTDRRPDCMKCHGDFICKKHYRRPTAWTLWATEYHPPRWLAKKGEKPLRYWGRVITVREGNGRYPRPREVLNEYLNIHYMPRGKKSARKNHLRVLPEGRKPKGHPIWEG